MKRSGNRYHYEFKKCQKSDEKVRKSKLLYVCLNGGAVIFSEIKSMRKSPSVVATSMDGVQDNVKEVFKDKYKKLYNSTEDEEELRKVQAEIESQIRETSIDDVVKVTPEIVKEAAQKLKPGKRDPVYSFPLTV